MPQTLASIRCFHAQPSSGEQQHTSTEHTSFGNCSQLSCTTSLAGLTNGSNRSYGSPTTHGQGRSYVISLSTLVGCTSRCGTAVSVHEHGVWCVCQVVPSYVVHSLHGTTLKLQSSCLLERTYTTKHLVQKAMPVQNGLPGGHIVTGSAGSAHYMTLSDMDYM
jgi:hypothetical protein